DDYFRRQEMDPVQREDELRANRALVELVDAYGPKMKVAAATSAAPAVVERCEQAGMELYWWNPMYDDYDKPGSLSRRLWESHDPRSLVQRPDLSLVSRGLSRDGPRGRLPDVQLHRGRSPLRRWRHHVDPGRIPRDGREGPSWLKCSSSIR